MADKRVSGRDLGTGAGSTVRENEGKVAQLM